MLGADELHEARARVRAGEDRKSTRLNSSHVSISYAVFCLKKKNIPQSSPRHQNLSVVLRSSPSISIASTPRHTSPLRNSRPTPTCRTALSTTSPCLTSPPL